MGAGSKAAVFGAGSWGTALAIHLARGGFDTVLWARRHEHTAALLRDNENKEYLPGFAFPEGLEPVNHIGEAVAHAEFIVLAVPTQSLRSFLPSFVSELRIPVPIVSASKGIEEGTLLRVSEILQEFLPSQFHPSICHLSGPSFAKEVASGMPTVVCVAAQQSTVAASVQAHLSTERFRVYRTSDEIGVELGGALKNVIALAVGCSDGLGLGSNARAGLLTRGLAEITRLAVHLGAHPLTLAGLTGMGDLILTCTGDLSRNRSVGFRIGQGEKLSDILASMNMVAEGVVTAKSTYDLAKREGIDMPITTEVYRVLYEGKDPKAAVNALMQRPLIEEREQLKLNN